MAHAGMYRRYYPKYVFVTCLCGHEYPFILPAKRANRIAAIEYREIHNCPVCQFGGDLEHVRAEAIKDGAISKSEAMA